MVAWASSTTAMNCSSSLRRIERWPDCASSAISSVRKKLRASCWVIVLAPTRYDACPAQVGHQRADDADRVDARMAVEAAVLDGQHRLLHVGGNGRERHPAAPLARRGDQRAEQRRIELDTCATGRSPAKSRSMRGGRAGGRGRRTRPARRAARPLGAQHLSGEVARARHEGDGAAAPARTRPGRRLARAARSRGRSAAATTSTSLRVRPDAQAQGPAVDPRDDPHALAGEARLDDQRQAAVVVAGHSRDDEDRQRDRRRDARASTGGGAATTGAARAAMLLQCIPSR